MIKPQQLSTTLFGHVFREKAVRCDGKLELRLQRLLVIEMSNECKKDQLLEVLLIVALQEVTEAYHVCLLLFKNTASPRLTSSAIFSWPDALFSLAKRAVRSERSPAMSCMQYAHVTASTAACSRAVLVSV